MHPLHGDGRTGIDSGIGGSNAIRILSYLVVHGTRPVKARVQSADKCGAICWAPTRGGEGLPHLLVHDAERHPEALALPCEVTTGILCTHLVVLQGPDAGPGGVPPVGRRPLEHADHREVEVTAADPA